jgi:hypothetical protein
VGGARSDRTRQAPGGRNCEHWWAVRHHRADFPGMLSPLLCHFAHTFLRITYFGKFFILVRNNRYLQGEILSIYPKFIFVLFSAVSALRKQLRGQKAAVEGKIGARGLSINEFGKGKDKTEKWWKALAFMLCEEVRK